VLFIFVTNKMVHIENVNSASYYSTPLLAVL